MLSLLSLGALVPSDVGMTSRDVDRVCSSFAQSSSKYKAILTHVSTNSAHECLT